MALLSREATTIYPVTCAVAQKVLSDRNMGLIHSVFLSVCSVSYPTSENSFFDVFCPLTCLYAGRGSPVLVTSLWLKQESPPLYLKLM